MLHRKVKTIIEASNQSGLLRTAWNGELFCRRVIGAHPSLHL